MEQQWEESEEILSKREMQHGVYRYHGFENRGKNDYGRPISVVTLERNEVMKMYYAPASLYWDLKRRPETRLIKYEGTRTSAKGYGYSKIQEEMKFMYVCMYPVFKFAK